MDNQGKYERFFVDKSKDGSIAIYCDLREGSPWTWSLWRERPGEEIHLIKDASEIEPMPVMEARVHGVLQEANPQMVWSETREKAKKLAFNWIRENYNDVSWLNFNLEKP